MTLFLFEDNQNDIECLKSALPNNYNLIFAGNIQEGKKIIGSTSFDVAIIDIFINNKPEGISLAQTINNLIPKKPVIFLTSSLDRTVFELAKYTEPSSYLIKPFNPIELQYAIELAFEEFFSQPAAFSIKNAVTLQDYIFIKFNKTISKVNIQELIYVKAEANYCNLFTKDKKYLIKVSLQKLLHNTLQSLFIQVHRNYVVNINMIKHIYLQDNLLVMINNEKIVLSHRFKSRFLKTVNLYQ
ncbi:LytR/AlgR family response regulator transcription factor [Abyssalbus ytuae]|uniref:LytTR family DNA-binding domain-containing protein n=1 Tax=Abyssalbus ytuae TaxID=2926907 RepID=A0A9E7D0D3_9FLAO|nr:LytTR family DNA-binding domain-containing protein [Abyssalbus ytuae]UOB18325.1 LytTR family DNA-binding domain-containing protein [Abyssalbus ytuae]